MPLVLSVMLFALCLYVFVCLCMWMSFIDRFGAQFWTTRHGLVTSEPTSNQRWLRLELRCLSPDHLRPCPMALEALSSWSI